MRINTVTLIGLLAVQPAFADVVFTPVDVPTHQYTGGWEHFVGGGLATFDCNGDRLPEIYAAGGAAPAKLLRNTSDGAIGFVDDTPDALAITGVTGAYPLDINGDGIPDLAILRVGENKLMQGLGNCQFTAFDSFELGGDAWTTAFSATWEGPNAVPTMVFGNYVDRADPDGPFETCDDSQLVRFENGEFSETALSPGYCTLSMLFSDWSRTGRADLRVSNDRHYYVRGGSEQMWDITQTPRLLGADDGWLDYSIWGMGIASRDLTGDGLAEVYLTSMGDQKLQTLVSAEAPTFEDYTFERGTTAHRPFTGGDGRPSTGWHVSFGDVDNDGDDDIFVAKGNVEQMPGAAMQDPNNLMLQDADGDFSESADVAGVASMARSRGAALVDFNGDGRLDLAVNNRRADLEVYENTTMGGNWAKVTLSQVGANRHAVGAFIEMKFGDMLATREVTVGGGHAGGHLGAQHFGLGNADRAEMRVIWPDGTVSGWTGIAANTSIALERAP